MTDTKPPTSIDDILALLYNSAWIEGSNWESNNPEHTPIPSEREVKRTAQAKAQIATLMKERKQGYDINLLGSWIFIGDKEKLDNFDDLYWSYVMEVVAESDPYAVSTGNYSLDYIKKQMKYASFGGVGITKMLARADKTAKERIALLSLNQTKGNE